MPANTENRPDRGFTLLIASLALMISMGALLAVAFKLNGNGTQLATAATTAAAPAPVHNVKISIKSDDEHGKLGPEGTWHDAFLPADFSVKPGEIVRVTVYNYDEGAHSFTSTELGTNVTIAAGSAGKPKVTKFTFHAPTKAGSYEWFCAMPCDPWAMNHDGFMRGYVKVT